MWLHCGSSGTQSAQVSCRQHACIVTQARHLLVAPTCSNCLRHTHHSCPLDVHPCSICQREARGMCNTRRRGPRRHHRHCTRHTRPVAPGNSTCPYYRRTHQMNSTAPWSRRCTPHSSRLQRLPRRHRTSLLHEAVEAHCTRRHPIPPHTHIEPMWCCTQCWSTCSLDHADTHTGLRAAGCTSAGMVALAICCCMYRRASPCRLRTGT